MYGITCVCDFSAENELNDANHFVQLVFEVSKKKKKKIS